MALGRVLKSTENAVRITNKHFMPGQVICLEKNRIQENLRVVDSCYVVDEDKSIYIPFTNSSRVPLKLKQGKRLAKFEVIEESKLDKLFDNNGRCGKS